MLTLGEFRQVTAHLDGDVMFVCCGANTKVLWENLAAPQPCISIDNDDNERIADELGDGANILFYSE